MKEKKQKNKEARLIGDADAKPFFSEKKNVVRLVLFLMALVLAVGSFSFAVYRMGYQEPGLHEIEADADGEMPFYRSGISFYYSMTGSSNEIRARKSEIKAAYTTALKFSYQWFDTERFYSGMPNLAVLNQNPGTEVTLSVPLFEMLSDALEKTNERKGYSVFAGPLVTYRDTVLYANDPVSVDPVNDPEVGETLAKLSKAIYGDDPPATLTLNAEKHSAVLRVSDAFRAVLTDCGMEDAPILDFNLLEDAYRLQYLAAEMENRGYSNGYLASGSGVTVLLREWSDASRYALTFDSLKEDGNLDRAEWDAKENTSVCCFRAFERTTDEYGFYTVEQNGETLYRHPFLTAFADVPQPLLTAMAICEGSNRAPDVCYACLRVFGAATKENAVTEAKATGMEWILDWNDGDCLLTVTSDEGLSVVDGYRVELLP